MDKINFVNGTAPYISATNLNQMQDNIENAIKKDILTVKAVSDQSIINNSFTKIIFGTAYSVVGTQLALKNNHIIIGEDISYVKVSCNIWAEAYEGNTFLRLLKNNEAFAHTIVPAKDNEAWRGITISPILLSVSKGDEISAEIQFSVANEQNKLSGATYWNSVNLTVEVI